MNKNQRIRVAQWGLGAMGQGVAKVILAKQGLELVGAFDIRPELAGKDVGEVLGVELAGVVVSDDPASILDPAKVDVITIATTSWVAKQLPDHLRGHQCGQYRRGDGRPRGTEPGDSG